jgi:predicted ATP-dependent serine protease
VTAPRLLAAARRVQHRNGLGLVIFDHLGCFDVERPRASEQEQMAIAVSACKDIAKILDVPFVLVTHLNRQGLIRGSERVKDISDNVLELKREGDSATATTEARLIKARQTGETHRAMLLSYSMKWQAFVEVAEVKPSAPPAPGGYGRSASAPATEAAPWS